VSTVSLRQASRLWDGEAGLHPIDLEVDSGELVVVRGRSGSGKSTLLALIAGVCAPGTGQVLVLDRSPRLDMPWSQLALVPQVLALSTELSIEENIADCAVGGGADAEEAVRASMERLGIAELARRTIGEVSMGQQQRAAVARATVADPKVLLADEPTSFQDVGFTDVVVRALRSAAGRGSAVIVATHDDDVARAADRIVDLTVVGAG
jgi:putative ABC transport system ATP-binding protein